MQKFVSENLWKEIAVLAKKSKVKKAAIAYVTADHEIEFCEGDLLIVDASNAAIASGETSAAVLARALGREAEIYSCPGLHTKVLLLDDIAVIGSANLSQSSSDQLIEAALLTDQPRVAASLNSFLHQLKSSRFSDRVDDIFVKRIKKISVVRRGRGISKRKRGVIPSPVNRVWIVTTRDLDDDAFPLEKEMAKKGERAAAKHKQRVSSEITWMRWTGRSNFRDQARAGDVVINIARGTATSKPYAVYKSLPILYRQEEPTCTRLYLEFSSQTDATSLTWSQFSKLCKSVALPRPVVPGSLQSISEEYADAIFSIWNKFRK